MLGVDGYPLHQRGIASNAPGLAFLGMRFQYRMSSALLGVDAAYVTTEIAEFLRPTDPLEGLAGARRLPLEVHADA